MANTQTTGDNFLLEENLEQLYMCIDDLYKCASKLGKRSTRAIKRPRVVPTWDELQIVDIIARLKNAYNCIFMLLIDPGFYETIAKDILVKMSTANKRFEISPERYKSIWEIITTPVITLIMDETDISKATKEKQERRKLFLQILMDQGLSRESTNETGGSPEENGIDIENTSSQDDNSSTNLFHNSCTLESVLIIKVISEAITLHTNRISKPDVELGRLVYYIVNITHLENLLNSKLAEIKNDLETENQNNFRTPIKPHLKEAIDGLENDMKWNLSRLEPSHKLSLYRKNLRAMLIKIRLLVQMMNVKRGE